MLAREADNFQMSADDRRAPGGTSAFEVRLLGPVQVVRSGREVVLGGPQPRAVLALLVLEAGRVVSAGRLVEELWRGPPPDAAKTLRSYMGCIRSSPTRGHHEPRRPHPVPQLARCQGGTPRRPRSPSRHGQYRPDQQASALVERRPTAGQEPAAAGAAGVAAWRARADGSGSGSSGSRNSGQVRWCASPGPPHRFHGPCG